MTDASGEGGEEAAPAGERTLLVAMAHPDDELGAAGSILAQRARGDRVVILWLTRGEMTEAFGSVPRGEIVERRREMGRRAGEILDAETRFLDFPDTAVEATPEAARRVARVIAEVVPDGVVTFGRAWVRGFRHPDHQATGKIVRDAITLARIRRTVDPLEPHRGFVPVFTYRDVHSRLPAVAVDVEPHVDRLLELARLYAEGIGFGDPAWVKRRLRTLGGRHGLRYAEEFEAWETEPGTVDALLPADPAPSPEHPDELDEDAEGTRGIGR